MLTLLSAYRRLEPRRVVVAAVQSAPTQVDPGQGDAGGRRGGDDHRHQGGQGGDGPPPQGPLATR